jgi:hypothetical protein
MVVLYPDHRPRPYLLANGFGESHIGLAICQPILLIEIHLAGMIMEEGPENGIGEPVVMTICNVIIEINGLTGKLFHKPFVDEGSILERDEESGPTNPSEV